MSTLPDDPAKRLPYTPIERSLLRGSSTFRYEIRNLETVDTRPNDGVAEVISISPLAPGIDPLRRMGRWES